MKKFIDLTREQLMSDYATLKSTRKVATKYGCSKGTILNKMNILGIERNKPLDVELVRKLAAEGISAKSISNIVGKCTTQINKVARQYGFKIKDVFHPGYITTHNGYLKIKMISHPFADSKGYVHVHRIIMENHIDRLLNQNEVVHHINGIKTDNRIENLELLPNISLHASLHRSKQIGRGKDKKPRKKKKPPHS